MVNKQEKGQSNCTARLHSKRATDWHMHTTGAGSVRKPRAYVEDSGGFDGCEKKGRQNWIFWAFKGMGTHGL
jgi:hypothetical protein